MFGGKEKSRTFASAIEKQTSNSKCPDGGIGRRAGLKHQWIHFHPGSTPGLGTKKEDVSNGCKHNWLVCPDGGIGRRAGLKHQWIHFHPGSTPGLGTERGCVKMMHPLFIYHKAPTFTSWGFDIS